MSSVEKWWCEIRRVWKNPTFQSKFAPVFGVCSGGWEEEKTDFLKIYYTAEVIETIPYSGVMSMLLVYGEYVCLSAECHGKSLKNLFVRSIIVGWKIYACTGGRLSRL